MGQHAADSMVERSQGEHVGKRIRRLRLERGLSQRELAGPGVSYAYISRIEAGVRNPSLKALRRLARRLRVSVAFLETGDPISDVEAAELRLSDAELELRLGQRLDRAEELFKSALSDVDEPEPALEARVHAGLGLVAVQRSTYSEAIRELEEAVGSGYLPPQVRPDVYYSLGVAYRATDSAQRAVDLYSSVLEQLVGDAEADVALRIRFDSYLSWAYSELGHFDRARPLLDDAMERAEDESVAPHAWVNRYWQLARRAWEEEEDAPAALSLMRRAIGLLEATEDTHQLARAHLLCAQLLNLDGRPDDAARHLAHAEPLLPLGAYQSDLGVLRAEQAKYAAHRGEAQRSLELAAEAARLLGEDTRHLGLRWHALAVAQAAAGNEIEALRHFEQSVAELERRSQFREAATVAREWAAFLRSIGREGEAFDVLDRAMEYNGRARRAPAPRV